MFTGIIEEVGIVDWLETRPEGGRIRVHAPRVAPQLEASSSIAVNGCCLTVVERGENWFACDLADETLRRTSFSQLVTRARVNLERPLTAASPLGGHFVQGHVDGVGEFLSLEPSGDNWLLRVRVPPEIERYVVLKGSIAVEGISLTVAGLAESVVEVAVIPFTYENTNLAALEPGNPVNIECDILAKYVEKFLGGKAEPVAESAAPAVRLTIERLREEGF
jgi:riboflavin synthase